MANKNLNGNMWWKALESVNKTLVSSRDDVRKAIKDTTTAFNTMKLCRDTNKEVGDTDLVRTLNERVKVLASALEKLELAFIDLNRQGF